MNRRDIMINRSLRTIIICCSHVIPFNGRQKKKEKKEPMFESFRGEVVL